uniref:Uncharacterized protein n=1 Tax=viral metagenome TaxID=1070528 RepID=A0A6M3LY95_9ZZZZ
MSDAITRSALIPPPPQRMAFHKIMQDDKKDEPCELVFTGEEKDQQFWRGKWFASCRNTVIAMNIVALWNRSIDENQKTPPNIDKPRKFEQTTMGLERDTLRALAVCHDKIRELEAENAHLREALDAATDVERLADIQHNIWASWMSWMFREGGRNRFIDGGEHDGMKLWTMNPEKAMRWQRQMETPFAALPEDEKESDRLVIREHMGEIMALREALEGQDDGTV